MQRWLFTLGSVGGAGVPLAFVLLVRHALSERQYIAAVVASLATYSVGLWGAKRRDEGLTSRTSEFTSSGRTKRRLRFTHHTHTPVRLSTAIARPVNTTAMRYEKPPTAAKCKP